jgi:hypothetical protein
MIRSLCQCACMLCALLFDTVSFLRLCLRPRAALAAEYLFFHKQLALYQERHATPGRATNATRLAFVVLARWFDWRSALGVVQPGTFTRWQRQGVGRFWCGTSCPGRPPILGEVQGLIQQMAYHNCT